MNVLAYQITLDFTPFSTIYQNATTHLILRCYSTVPDSYLALVSSNAALKFYQQGLNLFWFR